MILKEDLYIDIQPARQQDAPQMIKYLNQVGGESDNLLFGGDEFSLTIEQEEAWIQSMNQSLTSRVLIALKEGEIIGIGAFSSSTRERIAHHGEVALSVKRRYWNRGVGRAIMQELIRFARSNGITEIIHLGVRADNQAAIALYQGLGFEEIGRFPNFFRIDGRYYDEILMNLSL